MKMNQRRLVLLQRVENPYKDLDDINEIDLKEYHMKLNTEKKQIERGYSRVFLFSLNFLFT